jgi:hypothetical protein
MSLRYNTPTKDLALRMLAREGIAAIWQLQMAAADASPLCGVHSGDRRSCRGGMATSGERVEAGVSRGVCNRSCAPASWAPVAA